MNIRRRNTFRHGTRALALVALVTPCCLVGCGGMQSAPTSSAEPSSAGSVASAPAPDPAEAEAQASPQRADDAAPAEEAPPAAPAPEASQTMKKSSLVETDLNRLNAANLRFTEAMQPERLSCDAARPHRDAICEIAQRLCELSAKSPSSTNSREDCGTAKSSCEEAQRKFKERCGK